MTVARILVSEALTDALMGPQNANLRSLESILGLRLSARGNELFVEPADPGSASIAERMPAFVEQLTEVLRRGTPLRRMDVVVAARLLRDEPEVDLTAYLVDSVIPTPARKLIYPKSKNQKLYLDAIKGHDLVFGIGPAGTGKTYLAAAAAVAALVERRVRRLVLARPAVEAGERLGFLPGDLAEKVDPYLRPLYDALYDFMDPDSVRRAMERGTIEVAPIAFMRGRTLNDAFIILDEAQNTTSEQMKMFLTRIGFGSKAVVTGDVTQVDLVAPKVSGLREVQNVVSHIDGIAMVQFEERDVVRHPLVQKIVRAYDQYEVAARARATRPERGGSGTVSPA